MVEGDALALARRLGPRPRRARRRPPPLRDRRASSSPTAGTSTWSAARRETYPRPGALPEVAPGTLADDLARRDFTINAVALRLSAPARRPRRSSRRRGRRRGRDRADPAGGRLRGGSQPPGARGALRGPPGVPAGAATPPLPRARRRRTSTPGSARVADELRAWPRSPRRRAPWRCSASLGVPWLSGPATRACASASRRSTRRWPAPVRRRFRPGPCGWARRSTPTPWPGPPSRAGLAPSARRRAPGPRSPSGSTPGPPRRRSTGSCGRRRRRRRSGRSRAAPRRWPAGGPTAATASPQCAGPTW